MSQVTRRSIAHRSIIGTSQNATIDLITVNDSPGPSTSGSNESIPPENNLYKELQQLEEQDGVIRNVEFIFCSACDHFVDIYDGILVRECLHQVCIDCLRKIIIDSTKTDVDCPSTDCQQKLQDREIRCLLTQSEYERHMNKATSDSDDGGMYKELLELEQQCLIHNSDPFECSICFNDTSSYEGVLIRECLHPFCIDCIRSTINLSEEAEIMCPANECECFIQDREIRSLLTQAEFDKYTTKTLRIAESKMANSYHCKKANCEGWCIVDDRVNTFICQVCFSENCLSCQAIHADKNCKQYQDELRYAGMNDDQRSELCLDEIVQKNLGMRCTLCKIVIMKREGCDNLTCSMCKTELCWATKMSRWGPGGRGDTSGGCHCMPTKRCHPECRNCH